MPGVTFSAAGGTRVRVTAVSTVNGLAALARDWPPFRMVALELVARSPLDLLVTGIGDGLKWRVRLEIPGAKGRVRACVIRATEVG